MARKDEPLGDIATDVLFENDHVKIWTLVVEPGEASSWHLHLRDYITVVVESADITLELENGVTQPVPSPVGRWTYHGQHDIHRVINNTKTRFKNILIELKS